MCLAKFSFPFSDDFVGEFPFAGRFDDLIVGEAIVVGSVRHEKEVFFHRIF